MISICLRSVHVVSSVSLSNLFFSQNSFPQRFAGVQFMSPIYFIFSCRTIDRGCFGLSLIYQTIGNTSSFPMISSLICLLVYSRSYTRCSGLQFPSFYVRASQTSRQFALHFRVIQSIGDVLDCVFYTKR